MKKNFLKGFIPLETTAKQERSRMFLAGFNPLETTTVRRKTKLSLTGFTLIELMLVVIIIGILSAMVIPRLAGRSEEARKQTAKSDINAGLSLALDLYEMDMGKYPESLDGLRSKPADAENWRGPYIKKKSVDPWGKPYIYKFPGEHNPGSYDILTYGKDGKEGGGDDVTNWEE